jgi:hypothetical protein
MSGNPLQPDERTWFRHYILICWRDGDSQAEWRFTVVDARTEERRSFRELTAVAGFLDARLAEFETHDE